MPCTVFKVLKYKSRTFIIGRISLNYYNHRAYQVLYSGSFEEGKVTKDVGK